MTSAASTTPAPTSPDLVTPAPTGPTGPVDHRRSARHVAGLLGGLAATTTGSSVSTVGTPWLNLDEMRAWRAYVETVIDLQHAIERDLAPFDLTLGDYQVLVYLSEADEHRMRMRDLAELLQLSPSGLTRRLDGLVRAGHVEREPSADDGRVMMAVLTESGFAHLEATAPHHVRSVRHHILDRLSPTQVCALGDIFETIATGLAECRSAGELADESTA